MRRIMLLSLLLAMLVIPSTLRAEDLLTAQEKAFSEAVEKIAAAVVRIETTGGKNAAEGASFGIGPTTGLIIDSDGYIISSSFAFSDEPASILVRLSDGTRKAARLVATDHSRKIVLLKIDAETPLPVAELSPSQEMRVGQWTIAVGRTYEPDRCNRNVGILSAVDRIWGKAIQTDASVSPSNYGGPLIDIRGRVLGVLVPLSPDSTEEIAGVQWYDSGIGFAIPLECIQKVLPRLQKGENLHAGLLGLNLKDKNVYAEKPILGKPAFKSPAAAAGIQEGDEIVEIDGRPIRRAIDIKEALGPHYAGDAIQLIVRRGEQDIEMKMTCVEKLEPEPKEKTPDKKKDEPKEKPKKEK